MSSIYPQQTLPRSKKNKEWSKQCADYFIAQASFDDGAYKEMVTLYHAAEGKIRPSEYNYVLNPYGSGDGDIKKFPSKLRNYDIISPAVQLFLGERSKRPNDDQVIALNADAENKFTESLGMQVKGILAQQIVNELNKQGVETGVDSQEVPPIQQVVEKYNSSYVDERAIIGQEALNYIVADCDLDEKLQQLYYHWLVSGRCISYKEPYSNDVDYDVVHPMDFWCFKSLESPFIEDSSIAVRRRRMTVNEVIDRFRSKLSKEDIDDLTQVAGELTIINSSSFVSIPSANLDGIRQGYGVDDSGLLFVYHNVWKSQRKIYILAFIDEIGQPQEMEVDETYKIDKAHGDISLTEEWINEVWHNWKIGDKIYIDAEPFPVQRDELNNSSNCKLPYNGRYEMGVSGDILSMVKTGLTYQVLFNIYQYRREMTINKNKDKIMLMPMGLVPKEFGGKSSERMKKFMHFMDATSIGWFDETKPNAAAVMSALKTLDMNLYQYIEGMTRVIQDVKNEFWDAIGMNRQRYGDTQASDGKGVNEQAIFRSAVISAERNRKFEKFREKDMNGLLDTSKVAYIDGKHAAYITSDRRKAFFNINPINFCESQFGVFSKDNQQEADKHQKMEQIAFAMAQKGTIDNAVVAEIIDAHNFSKIKEIMKEADALETRREQAENDANRETQKYIADKNEEVNDKKNDTAIRQSEIHADAVVAAASIAADAKMNMTDNDTAFEEISLEREKLNVEAGIKKEDIAERRTANERNAQVALKKIEADKQKNKSKRK